MRTDKNVTQNVLPIEEAAIQERQVTVQVLTIGTKQVTQSLYKQLAEKNAIEEETGILHGPVWGWVNLHIDCKYESDHFHVVWEDNGQLKRSTMPYSFQTTALHRNLNKKLNLLAKAYLGLVSIANKKFDHIQDEKVWLTVKGQKISIEVHPHIKSLWDEPQRLKQLYLDLIEAESSPEYKNKYTGTWKDRCEDIQYIKEQIKKEPEHIDFLKMLIKRDVVDITLDYHMRRDIKEQCPSYADIYEEMEEIAEKMTKIENQWEESRQAVEKAGQLFIAVSGVWK